MVGRWEGCLKVHEGCGGLVRWVEAVLRPGIGYHGECLECGAEELPIEQIVPVELPENVRAAHQHEYWGARRLKVWADLSWDEEADWDANQQQIQERVEA